MTEWVLNIGIKMQKHILAQQIWLWTICFFIGLMVVVGGATRLTNSGLSITEWKPILGAIPPLNAADWALAFEKYKKIPEYLFEHADMTVETFKSIFWWEWSHRFLGRFVGILWFVPFAYFLIRKQIVAGYVGKYLILGVLGGAQGVLGWYMVMSGLVERVDVSQYRLAAHLGLAIFLLALSFWYSLELGILRGWNADEPAMPKRKRGVFVWFVLLVIFIQILLGALVAGTDAGLAYNTWPLMGDLFIPDGLYDLMPAWLSAFEDVTTIQFNHRMLAYCILILVAMQAVVVFRSQNSTKQLRRSLIWVKAALLVQVVLGILTLLTFVHLHTALTHQIGAVILLMAMISHTYKMAYEYK